MHTLFLNLLQTKYRQIFSIQIVCQGNDIWLHNSYNCTTTKRRNIIIKICYFFKKYVYNWNRITPLFPLYPPSAPPRHTTSNPSQALPTSSSYSPFSLIIVVTYIYACIAQICIHATWWVCFFSWSYGFVVDNSELDYQYRAYLDKKLVLLLEVISHLWFFV